MSAQMDQYNFSTTLSAPTEYPIDNSTAFNMSVPDYLLLVRGPKTMSYSVLLPITIVYLIIFVAGIIGNVSTVLVIHKNPRMHTATNFYLVSLAISDLVTLLLGLPNDLYVYWHQYPYIFGQAVCSVRALISEMTSNASVLTIMAFTVERYFAICHPLKFRVFSKLTRALMGIGGIWFLGLISAVPFAVLSEVSYVDYPPNSGEILAESAFCRMTTENGMIIPLLQFSSFAFFVVPMILIIVLYILIGITLKKTTGIKVQKNKDSRNGVRTDEANSQLAARRSIVKMLVAVVVAFFICFAPYHAQRLFVVYVKPKDWTHNLRLMNEYLFYVTGCLYFLSCTVNPILYNVMSAQYRKAFKSTVCGCCYGKVPRSDSQMSAYYHSSVYNFRTKCMNDHSQPSSKLHPIYKPSLTEECSLEASNRLLPAKYSAS